MKLNSLTFLLASTALCCSTASNATILSASSSGVIANGYDGLGLFGVAGSRLDGLTYTASLSFDRNLNKDYVPTFYGGNGNGNSGTAPATISLTVGSKTFQEIVVGATTDQLVDFGLSTADASNRGRLYDHYRDGISSSVSLHNYGTAVLDFSLSYGSQGNAFVGANADVGTVFSDLQISSPILDWSRVSFNYSLGGGMQPPATYFYVASADHVSFNTLAADASPVDEPATLAVFTLGLASLSLLARRKKTKAETLANKS